MKKGYVSDWIAISVVLVLAILGFFHSLRPSYAKVRPITQAKGVSNNLRQIASAGQSYMLEEGVSSVTYKQLEYVYFAPIFDVSGESYDHLVIKEGGGTLQTTMGSGKVVTFTY